MDAVAVRRLVAVSWSMPPSLYPRSIQIGRLLKGLSRLGWSSTVVTLDEASRRSDPLDPALFDLYSPYYQAEAVPARSANKRPRDRSLRRRLGKLPAVDAHWTLDATAATRRVIARDNPEVLVTFAQPWRDNFIGVVLGRPRIPWVAHFSDPWVDSLYYRDMRGADRDRDERCEAEIVRRADRVVFTNRYAADLVMAKYPEEWRAKARVVEHATDADLLPIVDRLATRPRAAGAPLRLAYVGTLLADRRTIDDLLTALANLDSQVGIKGRVELAVIGSGSGTEAAKQQAAELGLDTVVSFHPPVMYLESLAAMRESNVLVLIDARARTNVFLPSKLMDYVMVSRPILAITPTVGASADVVRSAGYPTIEPGDIAGVAAAIEGLLKRHESEAGAGATPDVVTQRHGLENVSAQFAAVLQEAVAGFSWRQRWL